MKKFPLLLVLFFFVSGCIFLVSGCNDKDGSDISKYESREQHRYEEKIIDGDSVIINLTTGLMWHQSGTRKHMKLKNAMKWLEKLRKKGYAGYHDWTFPTMEEAESLFESSKNSSGLYIAPVFSNRQRFIWTNTGYVSFLIGRKHTEKFVNQSNFVRPVRLINKKLNAPPSQKTTLPRILLVDDDFHNNGAEFIIELPPPPKPVTTNANRIIFGVAGISNDNDNGVTSYLFDGIDDYLETPDSVDWDVFGNNTDNWIMSLFVKWSGDQFDRRGKKSSYSNTFFFAQGGEGSNRFQFFHNPTNGICLVLKAGGNNSIVLNGGDFVSDTNWHHVAVTKVADEYGSYIDGIQTAYVQDTSTYTISAPLQIGKMFCGDLFQGNMYDMFIEQSNVFSAAPNVEVTDTITVPTPPYTKNANTKLLIHCDETITSGTTGSGAVFIDSTGNHIVTENANAIRVR